MKNPKSTPKSVCLVVYHSQTAPLIDWYKNEGKYQHIHGLGTMDAIFADIVAAVEDVYKRQALFFALWLKGENKKKGYGLEEPNIKK